MPVDKNDPRRANRSKLPYVKGPGGVGWQPRRDKRDEYTFAHHTNHSVTGNLFGNEEETQFAMVLRGTSASRISIIVALGDMTVEELNSFKEFVMSGISAAMPIAEARDKEVQDALEAGDDSNYRLYRPAPTFSIRTRALIEYSDRLRSRPSGVPDVEEPELPYPVE